MCLCVLRVLRVVYIFACCVYFCACFVYFVCCVCFHVLYIFLCVVCIFARVLYILCVVCVSTCCEKKLIRVVLCCVLRFGFYTGIGGMDDLIDEWTT